VDEGFFEEEGLDVKAEILQNAAAGVPALLNGELQFLESAAVPTIGAVSQGAPIVVVGNETTLNDAQAVLVTRPDGPKNIADLTGKSVAVNALKAFHQLADQAAIDAAGGDSTKTKFIELPFSDMIGALQSGRVDAITLGEPLSTIAQGQGLRVLGYPHEALPSASAAGWQLASREYAEKNEDVVERFQRALAKSVTFASENPDRTLEVIPSYLDVPSEVLEKAVYPDYVPEVSLEAAAELGALMQDYSYVSEVPEPEDWILQ
jgi:NitT/TauT family transport system substrate-binding protein